MIIHIALVNISQIYIMTKKINPFVKSSIMYIIATVFGQGMSFLGIVVFTRLMNQTDYGNYSTYYAYVSIFTVLIGANLYYALNNAYIDFKQEIVQFRKSVLFLSTVIMVTLLLLALMISQLIWKTAPFFIVLMVAIHSYGFFVINYRIYSANMGNEYKKKALLLVLPNLFQLVFATAFILFFPKISFEARVVGSVVGVGSIAFIEYLRMISCEGKIVNKQYWKYALSISLQTMVMSLSYMLMQRCDTVMITRFCGANETAIYSVIYYLGYAIIVVDQAAAPVRQAWIFHRLEDADMHEARNIQKWYLLCMAVIASCLLLIGPELIKIITPKNYWEFEYIIPFVLSSCFMILYRFFTEILLYYKKNILLSVSVLLCAFINLVLNVIFIPKFGAIAAGYTTVVAYSLLFIITWRISEIYYGKMYVRKYFIFFIIWIGMLSTSCFKLYNHLGLRYILLMVVLICTMFYLLRKKSELFGILLNSNKEERGGQ